MVKPDDDLDRDISKADAILLMQFDKMESPEETNKEFQQIKQEQISAITSQLQDIDRL